MSDFTEADVERGNIAGFTRKTVQDVLAAVAPAMRDRWRQEWEAEHQCLRPYTETDTQSWP